VTPADAAAVERAQRVRATAGADATPEVAAGLAADVLALAAALRKLRWCVEHERDPATLRLVTPAAIETWLAAHGWREHSRVPEGVDYIRNRRHPVFVCAEASAAATTGTLREIKCGGGGEPALVLAQLLPAAGPWDDDGGSE